MHRILIDGKLSLYNKVLVYPKCPNVQMFHVSFLFFLHFIFRISQDVIRDVFSDNYE